MTIDTNFTGYWEVILEKFSNILFTLSDADTPWHCGVRSRYAITSCTLSLCGVLYAITLSLDLSLYDKHKLCKYTRVLNHRLYTNIRPS